MKRADVFPSNYLGKADIARPMVVVIDAVRMETIKGEHGDEDKPVLYFQGDMVKRMILNAGNWDTLEETYGDSDDWSGKRVEIYVDPNVMYGGKRVGGVRLRIPNTGIRRVQPTYRSWEQAVAEAGALGLSKDALIAALKAKGYTGYNPADCAPAMEAILSAARGPRPNSSNGMAFDDGPPPSGDDIPFDFCPNAC